MRAGPVASASLLHVAGLVSVLLLMRSPPLHAPAAGPVVEVVTVIDPAPPDLAPPEPAASQPAPASAENPPPDPPPQVKASAPEPAPAQDAETAPVPPQASAAEPIPSAAEPSPLPDPVQPAPPADTLPAAPEAEFPVPTLPVPTALPRAMTRVSPPLHAKLDRHEHLQERAAPVSPRPSAAVTSAPAAASTPVHAAGDDAAFEARIHDAVQAAVHYPTAARMMGLAGRTRVELDYRGGAVAHPSLAQSAGASLLDEAALAAARAARYPAPPPEVGGRLLRLLVWVEFKPG